MRSEEIAKGDADHVGPGARQRYPPPHDRFLARHR